MKSSNGFLQPSINNINSDESNSILEFSKRKIKFTIDEEPQSGKFKDVQSSVLQTDRISSGF